MTTDGEDNKEAQIEIAKKKISKANIMVETELRHSVDNEPHSTGFFGKESNDEPMSA